MRRRWRAAEATTPLVITVSVCTLSACGVDVGAGGRYDRPALAMATVRTAAAEERPAPTVGYEGTDFVLRYPADATVRPLDPEAAPGAVKAIEIRGPELRDVEGDPIEGSASYSFEVVTYANDERLPLEGWLARHRVRENAHDALSTADPARRAAGSPTSASVGGLPALRETRFGGDCDLVRYYVARGAQVVALRYADFPVESDSLNAENLRTYRRLMSTFRWKPEGAER